MAPAPQRPRHEPLYDVHPRTGASIEVFYSDPTLETFGRAGAGWFWWPRQQGSSPTRPPVGPFASTYSAYRHAMTNVANSADSTVPRCSLPENEPQGCNGVATATSTEMLMTR
jgi:hypothetical protein